MKKAIILSLVFVAALAGITLRPASAEEPRPNTATVRFDTGSGTVGITVSDSDSVSGITAAPADLETLTQQVANLQDKLSRLEERGGVSDNRFSMFWKSEVIQYVMPIIAIVLFFGTIILCVYFSTRFSYKREKERYEYEKFRAEQGIPVSLEEKEIDAEYQRNKGAKTLFKWVAIGFAIAVFSVFSNMQNYSLGINILQFLGLAALGWFCFYLLVNYVLPPREHSHGGFCGGRHKEHGHHHHGHHGSHGHYGKDHRRDDNHTSAEQ